MRDMSTSETINIDGIWNANPLFSLSSSSFEQNTTHPHRNFSLPQHYIFISSSSSNIRDFFLWGLSLFTTIVLIIDGVIQLACLTATTRGVQGGDAAYVLLNRVFGVGLTILAILCETESIDLVRNTALLQNRRGRGIFYIFIAIFTLAEYSTTKWTLLIRMSTLVKVFGFTLIGIGFVYILVSVLLLSSRSQNEQMWRYVQMLNMYDNSSYGSVGNFSAQERSIPIDLGSYHTVS